MTTPEPTSDPAEGADLATYSARHRAPLKRASSRFFEDPSSGRNAILLIVAADIAIVREQPQRLAELLIAATH